MKYKKKQLLLIRKLFEISRSLIMKLFYLLIILTSFIAFKNVVNVESLSFSDFKKAAEDALKVGFYGGVNTAKKIPHLLPAPVKFAKLVKQDILGLPFMVTSKLLSEFCKSTAIVFSDNF